METSLGIYIGRFQGVTKAHQKILDYMNKNFEKFYVLIVEGKNKDKRNPFDGSLRKSMIESCCKPSKILIVPNGFLPKIIEDNKLWDGEEKIYIAAGDDRELGYKSQFKGNEPFDVEIIKFDRSDNISGTDLRKSLKENDFETYKNIAADGINNKKWFDLLREKYLVYENNIIKALNILLEGGNLELPSGERAQRIELEKIDIEEIKKNIIETLKEFNKKFKEKNNFPLWKQFTIDNVFSGSSKIFFSHQIEPDEFKKYKKSLGDIDLMYPQEYRDKLKDFLDSIKGEKIGPCRYINRGGRSPIQFNVIFELPEKFWEKIKYLQIDFEPVKFENDSPTEFAKFSHNSSWDDLKEGIKGVFSKYLLSALISNIKKLNNYVILTNKNEKPSKSEKFKNPVGFYKFSVDKGMRIGYKPVYDENGNQKIEDGKFVYKEISPSESIYEDNLTIIFNSIFNKEPSEEDIKKLHSFLGILELIKKYIPTKNVENIFNDFIQLLWGKKAQRIDTRDDDKDKMDKMIAFETFLKKFPEFNSKKEEILKLIENYYS